MVAKRKKGQEGDFVVYHHKKNHSQSFKMQDHATIYQAELEAIYQACSYMDEKSYDLKPKYVKILTDSQSALLALNNIDFKSSKALKTAEALENIAWQTKNAQLPRLKHT